MCKKIVLLFLLLTNLLLLFFSQEQPISLAQLPNDNSRVRVYNSFGDQQGNILITAGPARVVPIGNGYAVVDNNEHRVGLFNALGILQNQPITTDGRAKIIPCQANCAAIVDNSSIRIYTLFGHQQGRTVSTDSPADGLFMGTSFIAIEDNRIRIFDLSANQSGDTISTNRRATVVPGNTGFAVIDNSRVRLYDLGAREKVSITTSGAVEVRHNNNIFTVIEDSQVRIYNVFGEKIGGLITTVGRANVAMITDQIIIADHDRVRFFAERTGGLIKSVVDRKGTARLVANIQRVAVIDDGAGKRLQIYDLVGNTVGIPLITSNQFEAKISIHNRFVVIEDSKVYILDPSGIPVNDDILNSGRAGIQFATDRIFVTDNNQVRIFDHFGNARGDVFNTAGRADVVVNVQGLGISNNQQVILYNYLNDVDGGTVSTIGTVSLATTIDRIIILDEEQDDNHAPMLNDGNPALATILEDSVDNQGMLIKDLIASATSVDLITDSDPGALEGIAVTAVNLNHGQWQFSIDKHRLRWQNLNAPLGNSARLLAADNYTRIRFVPQADFYGSVNPALTFRAWDQTQGVNGRVVSVSGTGGSHPFSSEIETANLIVTAVNDAPSFSKGADQTVRAIAGPQSIPNWATAITAGPANESNQTVNFVVTNNNNPLFVGQPAVTPAGTLTYEPASTAAGVATVTVRLNDNGGTANGGVNQSAAQTFTITILPNDGTPVAVDDEASTGVNTAVIIPVLNNDIEPNGDPLIITTVSTPAAGTATTDGTTITYTPTISFVGIDSFTYTISDGSLADTGTVTLFVGQVNRAPVLHNEGTPALAAIDEDDVTSNGSLISEIISSVLPLDMITDEDSGALEGIAIIDVDEAHGDWQYSTDNGGIWHNIGSPTTATSRLLAVDSSTRLRFVPDNHFNGRVDAGVTFRAWDQSSGSNGGTANTADNGSLTAFSTQTETASLVVNPVNDAPTAVPDSANTPNNTARTVAVLGNDSDVDGDLLTVTAVGVPDNGTATLNPDNTIFYEPAGFSGTAVFTYTIQDSGNLTDTASVTIQVGITNTAPVASDDTSQTFKETAISIPVLNNDVDSDGDTLIVSQVTAPTNGTATILNGMAIVYTPTPGFTGSDNFTYTLSDGDLTDTATVNVTVAGPSNDFWENDPFDDLNPTELHGQNGWTKARADRASAVVMAGDSAGDQILQIDPGAGQTIVMGKDVPDQANSQHTFSVLVKVTGPVNPAEPTLAKIEFGTNANQGWGKKFQLYFGASMRVNYGPALDDAVVFIPDTVLDQWYHIQVDMDLANNLLDLSVDGSQLLTGIPMHPGPITSLGISGWDRPGAVFLDEVRGWQTWDPGADGICGISTFDTGDEGWLVIGDAQDSSSLPDYHISGGNPGGYLSATDDVLGGTWYWVAPGKFLGDQLSAYNGTLSFDLRQSLTNSQFNADDVILGGNGLELVYDLPGNPGADWTPYLIVIHESAGWVNRASGSPATSSEMLTVLGALEKLHIRGEYRNGADVGSLDNVSFNLNGCPQTGTDIYWINPNGGDMAEPSNWSTNRLPTFADNVFITLSGNYTVTLQTSTHPVPLNFGSLTIGSDPVVWINANGNNNSLIHVDNTIINNGRILMQNNGPSDSTGFARLIVESGFLENRGVIDLLPGPGDRHAIYSNIINEGEFNQAATLDYSGTFVNRHIVNIAENIEFLISDPIEEISSFIQEDGAIAGLGTLVVNNQSSLNFVKGETVGPPPVLRRAFLTFEQDPTGIASFILHEGTTLTGDIGGEQTAIIGEEQIETASATIDGDLTNRGVIVMEVGQNTAVSSLQITNGVLTNKGNIHVNAGGGGSRHIRGNLLNQGTFNVNTNLTYDSVTSAATFTNEGALTIAPGQTMITGSGETVINSNGGLLQGEGTLDRSGAAFINAGNVGPGLPVGTLAITGNFPMTDTAVLTIDIDRNLPAGTDADQLQVTANAQLSGALDINVTQTPTRPLTIGESFVILTCGETCAGTFSTVNGTALGDGKAFTVTYQSQTVALEVVVGGDEPITNLQAHNDSPTTLGNTTVLSTTRDTGANITYLWDFGDGAIGSGQTVSHTYALTGTYTAVVTASNSVSVITATTTVTVQAAGSGAIIQVVPSPTTIPVGVTGFLTVTVSPGTAEVNGVQVHGQLDPAHLRLLDVQVLSEAVLPTVIDPLTFDADTGLFRYGAGLLGDTVSEPFAVLLLEVEGVMPITNTLVSFSFDFPATDVSGPSGSVLEQAIDGIVTVTPATTLTGTVNLQGRPPRPHPSWSIPLTVTFTPAGDVTPTLSLTVTTDEQGTFVLSNIPPGLYDIRIKGSHTLRNLASAVSLLPGPNAFHFGTLLEGDVEIVNTFNRIVLADFGLLSGSFNKCSGEPGFVTNADLNESGCITIDDFGLLSGNFNKQGDIVAPATPGLKQMESLAPTTGGTTADLRLVMLPPAAGDELITVQVVAEPNGAPVNGANVHLQFDPALLEVVEIELTAALPQILTDPLIDNSSGSVRFAAGILGQTYSETFVLATMTVRLQTGVQMATLVPLADFPATNLSGPSGSVLGQTHPVTLTVAQQTYQQFLPLIFK